MKNIKKLKHVFSLDFIFRIIISLIGLSAAAILVSSGCASAIPSIDERIVHTAKMKWGDTDKSELEIGRNLYIRKCSGCHLLYSPADYQGEKWLAIMESMSKTAKLEPGEKRSIEWYLVASSAVNRVK